MIHVSDVSKQIIPYKILANILYVGFWNYKTSKREISLHADSLSLELYICVCVLILNVRLKSRRRPGENNNISFTYFLCYDEKYQQLFNDIKWRRVFYCWYSTIFENNYLCFECVCVCTQRKSVWI